MKRTLKKLQQEIQKKLGVGSFELLSGQHYYFDKQAVGSELLRFGVQCVGTPPRFWEVPEVYHALTQAKDPKAALDTILEGGNGGRALFVPFPFDEEILIRERVLVPRPDVVSPVGDLSQ